MFRLAMKCSDPKMTTEPQAEPNRAIRADARRNLDALLRAAMAVFATSGVDAPVREIAEKAGVGVGTVYRHFPQRSDLIKAIVRQEVDACAEAAAALAADHAPGEALGLWMQRLVDFVMTKRGLAAALHSGDPAYQSLPDYFLSRLTPALQSLLDSAAAAGDVRGDVNAGELLLAGARLATPAKNGESAQARRMVALLVDGLRYGATANVAASGR
jgi:AcrR family transcriptional regulator